MATKTPTSTAAAGQPAKLPYTDPIRYTTREGHYKLAYASSPWDRRLYQVLDITAGDIATDVLCTVDDFGDLVITHRRNPLSVMGMSFKRVAA